MKEEVAAICNMVISPGSQHDKLVWVGTKNGSFLVRSMYHLAQSMGEQRKGSRSAVGCVGNIWKKIWLVKGPCVLHIFLWKACQNILPTKSNLFRHRITLDPLCTLCEQMEETLGHILWSCPLA